MTQKAAESFDKAFEIRIREPRKGPSGNREKRAGLSFLRQMDRLSRSSQRAARGRCAGKGAFVKTPQRIAQRVIVKARVVRNTTKRLLHAHVSYICRDSAAETLDKAPSPYDREGEISRQAVTEFVADTAKDRHHFRFIISPENAVDLDLTAFTNEVMGQMEKDLGSKLSFIAINHFNTDNPHAHVLVQGKDEEGRDLVISRDYLANGIRGRAMDVATRHLGHRNDLEIRAGITAEVTKERLTQIDRDLLKAQGQSLGRTIDMRLQKAQERTFAAFKRAVQLQRLKELQKMGLAAEVKPGVWRLEEKMEVSLKELGERHDIIKTMHKALKKDPFQESVIFNPADDRRLNITGVVMEKGLRNEMTDENYMILSATDSRAYYVPLSKYSEDTESMSKVGSIVTVSVKKAEGQSRKVDDTIERIAHESGGIYSADTHRKELDLRKRLPEGVSIEAYLQNHVKRLEALEVRGLVKRVGEAAWEVPKALQQKILETGKAGKRNFVQVKLESFQDLEAQVTASAPTWLDQQLVASRQECRQALASEFVKDLQEAKNRRLEKLCELNLAVRMQDGVKIRETFRQKVMSTATKDRGKELSRA